MATSALTRFFGGHPGWVILRLALLSVVIGLIFSALGIHPYDLVDTLKRAIMQIWDLGFEAIEKAFSYFILGALVVFPVWFIMRTIKTTRRRGSGPTSPRDS
ncbi:MAG: integrase [Rhizobiales bacterium]|nr:integrase [Hyphomicrobiales bacterium]